MPLSTPTLLQSRDRRDEKQSWIDVDRETGSDFLALFAELSGVDAHRLDPKAIFFELGFDSLGLTQAVVQIQKRFGVKVTFRQLLADLPTIESLADYVGQHPSLQLPKLCESRHYLFAKSPSRRKGSEVLRAPVDRSGEASWKRLASVASSLT